MVGNGNAHILPDSRLADPHKNTIMGDWPLPDGRTVRIELSPVFCANCGKSKGYVPTENTSFAFWLCDACFETHGAVVGTMAVPDDEWHRAVQHEMQERFGHDLTAEEIAAAAATGQLGSGLEKLMQESPFKAG